MSNNYSSLKNNYMYGYNNRLNNYYQNYKNFENDLDDPIFTGFTLYINMQQSPLFGDSSMYLSNEGSSIDGTSLAAKIENSIKKKHDNQSSSRDYEVSSTIVETFDSERRIGYGNQNKILSEGFSYNALEYIYMVDKITAKTENNNNNSIFGSQERGSKVETADTKQHDESSKQESNNNGINQEELDKNKEDYIENIDKNAEKQSSLFDEANELYKKLKGEYDDVINNMKLLNDKISSLNKEISLTLKFKNLIVSSKDLLITFISCKLGKSINLDLIPTESVNCRNYMAEYYEKYKDDASFGYMYGIEHLSIPESAYESIKNDLAGNFNKDIDINWIKEDVAKPIIECAYCTFHSENYENNIYNLIDDLYDKIKDYLIELYGKGENGGVLNESNALADSLYGRYIRAKNKLEEIRNSDEMNKIAEASNGISNALDGVSTDESTVEQEEKISQFSGDISTNQNQSSIVTYAPQTCVDLVGFINGMKKITESNPYIFQSVTGLDEAYKKYFKNDEPFQGSSDNKITINCYESLDMRVSSMFNKYFNAVYDREYKRERVPMNLRRFNCSIFVHDIRNFRHTLNLLSKDGAFKEDNDNVNQSLITEVALNHLSVVEFKFFDCEISQEDTGNIFSTINNADNGEQRMTTFTFNYGNCYINFLPFNDLVNYYKTSGDNSYLGDETKEVESTKSKKIKSSEQISDFKENEEKILSGKMKNLEGILVGFENVNQDKQDDNEKYYYIDNNNKYGKQLNKEENNNIKVGYLGNVEYNDYDEYMNNIYNQDYNTSKNDYFNRVNADDFSHINAEILYNENRKAIDITMRSLSASTGYPIDEIYNKFGLGNVYKENTTNQSNDKLSSNDISADNDYLEIKDKIILKDGEYSEKISMDDITVESLVNKYKETDKKLFGDKNNNGINDKVNGTSTTDYVQLGGDKIGIIKEKTKESHIFKLGSIDSTPNATFETLNEGFNNTDKTLFGNDYVRGINDKVNGTSETDYIQSIDDNLIGKIQENTIEDTSFIDNGEGNVRNDGVTVNKIYSNRNSTKKTGYVSSIGNVYNNENGDLSQVNDLGNAFGYKTPDNDDVTDIDNVYKEKINKVEVNNIGKINYNTEDSGDFKTYDNVYKDKLETSQDVSSIGKLNQDVKSNGICEDAGVLKNDEGTPKEVNNIGTNFNETREYGTYKSSKLFNYNDNSRNVESIGNAVLDNTTEQEVRYLGKYVEETNDDGIYVSEKRNNNEQSYEIVKRIGNVYKDTTNIKIEFDDLNDVSFT